MARTQNRDANGTVMITFEKPLFLLFIAFTVPAYVLTLHRIKELKTQYPIAEGITSIIWSLKIRTMLWALSWVCLCAAVATPLWGTKPISTVRRGDAIIFAIDISRSMTVPDILPNRLEFAKHYVNYLIEGLPDSACGLVTIKGQGTLAVPLSFNHQSIMTAVETLSPFSATAAGSNLEHGLQIAADCFPKNRVMGKTIILCTDGGETKGAIERILPHLRVENIRLIIVGFGTQAGGTVSILNEHHESVLQNCTFDEALLTRYAEQVLNGSLYISATETSSAPKVLHLLQEEKTENRKIQYVQRSVRRTFECTVAALIFFCTGLLTGGLCVKKY